ncbi:hypothetical protein Hanom_Chr01g00041641 [Helianthus anomalus]
MKGEVLPIIPLSCIRAGGGRVSVHLGDPGAGDGRVVDIGIASGVTIVSRSFLVVQKNMPYD